ncbi:tyrosine protein phosphatase [Thalassobacillus devorans]|uniref:Tyrosine-protein phosphatase n=1 Tax=Thalassobacillus devorans TaxID=279813 RepID=A0ABQ1P1K9_9BACI|nr:CpsB/CapC family capsule biosynthesis tyrosine phosphatase [Thalassobacillus devorans]NIK28594.1 protein-tyrosine phosphatase [Thalassobacillus devorans]GGC85009.1 tyrosine protein phosphatase [Thalassobacillus devorans]
MIDIHSHLLPGVDDGAQTLEDSLAMAREAVSQGIDTIVATPHHRNGKYTNPRLNVLYLVQELNFELERAEIPLTVLPGQEVRIHGDMIEELKEEVITPINIDSGYIFVELPNDQVPNYTISMLFELQRAGYIPIIVHPERNKKFIEDPNLLYQFVKSGAYTQVTAGSVAGKFGKSVQKFSHQLIEANLTHVIASDAHDTKRRGFFMKEAMREIKKKYGASYVYHFTENAYYIINGQVVAADPPERIKQKKFLKIF